MISYTGHQIHLETAALAIGSALFILKLLVLGMGANKLGRESHSNRALSRLEVVLRFVWIIILLVTTVDYSHDYSDRNNVGEAPTILLLGLILLTSRFIFSELRLPTLKP